MEDKAFLWMCQHAAFRHGDACRCTGSNDGADGARFGCGEETTRREEAEGVKTEVAGNGHGWFENRHLRGDQCCATARRLGHLPDAGDQPPLGWVVESRNSSGVEKNSRILDDRDSRMLE